MANQNHAKTRQELAEQLEGDKVESVTHYLMMSSYDVENHVYTLADGSLGVVIRIVPKPSSMLNDRDLEEISDALSASLSRLPDNAIGQVTLIPTPNIDEVLDNYASMGNSTNIVIASLQKRKIQFFRNTIRNAIFTNGEMQFRTKMYVVICTITVQTKEMVGSGQSSFIDFCKEFFSGIFAKKDGEKKRENNLETRVAFKPTIAERRYLDAYESLVKDIHEASRRLVGILDSRKIQYYYLAPQELINVTQAMIWPKSSAKGERVKYNESAEISRQIAYKDIAVFGKTGSIITDNAEVYHKVISLAENVDTTMTGALTRPNPDLGWLSLLDYLGDGFLTINFHLIPLQQTRSFLETRKAQVKGGFSMPGKRDELLRDCLDAENMVEAQKRRFFNLQVCFSTYGEDERTAEDRANNLRQKIDDTGLRSRKEEHFAASVFFSGLPFGWAPAAPEAKRMWMVADRVIGDLAPIYGQGRGTKNACFLAHNRYGEPFILDLFDTNTAPHFMIVGESGSGKSFLTTALILDWCRDENARAYIIDRGKSYSTITNRLGGQFNQLTLSNKTCTNVFAGTQATAGAFAVNFLEFLGSKTASEQVTSSQAAMLEHAKEAAYKEMQATISFTDYNQILEHPKAKGKKCWIDRAYKRMRIAYLDQARKASVDALKAADESGERDFVVYYQSILYRRTYTLNNQPLTEDYTHGLTSIGPQTRELLTSRSFILEDRELSEGVFECVALYQSEDKEQLLENSGIQFQRIEDEMVLLVAKPEDMRELADTGIAPIYSDKFKADCLAQAQASVNADTRIRTIDNDILETKVAQIYQDLCSPRRYYDHIEGEAVIQFEVTMTGFISCLKDIDKEDAQVMVNRLRPYYGAGTYSGFFDGTTGFDLVNPKIVCWEMGELDSAGPHIVAGVMTALLQAIYIHCQNSKFRGFRKLLALDEFWAFLKIDLVAQQIINVQKTGRKFGLAIGVISQSIKDFTPTENGRKVLESSQCKFIMKQTEDVIQSLPTSLGFSLEKTMMAATVHTRFGQYSEALVDFPSANVSEIMRLCPVPYIYWLSSTDKTDVKLRDRLVTDIRATRQVSAAEALDMALTELSDKYPNGAKTAGIKL